MNFWSHISIIVQCPNTINIAIEKLQIQIRTESQIQIQTESQIKVQTESQIQIQTESQIQIHRTAQLLPASSHLRSGVESGS